VGQPWHLVVNFTGPHDPMDVTRRMEQTTRGRRYPEPHRNTQHPPAKHQEIRQNYAAMIENLDRWTGRFLDEVKRRGELDNTLIVYSSDHGEMLGDHNLWGKSLPHEASIRVPLIMAGPRVKRAESRAMVYVHDLAATFLDYAGVSVPQEMDSRSLRPLLEGKTRTHRDYQRTGLNKWRTVFDGRWKLVEGYGESGPRLYDLAADPTEDNNLAARETAVLERLRHLAE
jgi:arylsulfatase A-like enzyme